jgi:hypothetical protein
MTTQIIVTLVGYFVFSAAAGAMAAPTEAQTARFYGWFYRFIQRLAANADRVAEARFGNIAGPATSFGGASLSATRSETVIEQHLESTSSAAK